jgi:cytochrome P450
MARVTLQVILRTIFGIEEGARFSEFARLLEGGMDNASTPILLFPFAQRDLGRFSPWGRFLRFKAEADRVLYEEIARGRAAAPGREDILSLLCAARDEDGAPMTAEEIRDELVTMLVAGHETTATGLCWAFRWLLDPALPTHDPTLLPRLKAEVRGARVGAALAPEKVARLELLDATVREALRLKPVVPIVGRVLRQPRRVLGHDLPAGTMVAPSIYLVHRRPSLYPEPGRFRPERFLGFRPAPHEYFPFGGGLRRCIGAAFAIQEMKMIMAAILDGTDLGLAPGYRERVKRRGVTLTPSEGMPVVLRGRGG